MTDFSMSLRDGIFENSVRVLDAQTGLVILEKKWLGPPVLELKAAPKPMKLKKKPKGGKPKPGC